VHRADLAADPVDRVVDPVVDPVVDLAGPAVAPVDLVVALAAKPVDPETCRNTSGNYVNLKK